MLHRLLALPLAALLLIGCASTVTTQVTAFHQLSESLQGKRFVILRTAEQQNSLEFTNYAALVREALIDKGLVHADEARDAELGVSMSYSASDRSSGSRGGTGAYAGFGAGTGGFTMGGVGIGIGFPIGGARSGRDSNTYVHNLRVEIDRLTNRNMSPSPSGAAAPSAMPGSAEAARVYEARATSEASTASPAPVMRAMVRAVFEEFPGESGRTRVVRVPLGAGSETP